MGVRSMRCTYSDARAPLRFTFTMNFVFLVAIPVSMFSLFRGKGLGLASTHRRLRISSSLTRAATCPESWPIRPPSPAGRARFFFGSAKLHSGVSATQASADPEDARLRTTPDTLSLHHLSDQRGAALRRERYRYRGHHPPEIGFGPALGAIPWCWSASAYADALSFFSACWPVAPTRIYWWGDPDALELRPLVSFQGLFCPGLHCPFQ